MWYWWRMEKIKWTYPMRHEKVLGRVKEEKNTPHKLKRNKANWIGHILRKTYLLKHVMEEI
jgi:hypothetical protein